MDFNYYAFAIQLDLLRPHATDTKLKTKAIIKFIIEYQLE